MVIALLLFALVLRLINLNQSLWLDEAVQAITSAGPLSGLWSELIGDFHPPLYHLFMWVWVHLFGNSEISMRLPSVLFGAGTVYFGYKIALVISDKLSAISTTKLTTDRWLPITAIFLFATSPYLIYYSQEARMYSMSAFLATLSSYIFIKLINYGGRTNQSLITDYRSPITICYLLTTVLFVYTDYYGWLVVLAQLLILAYRKSFKSLIINSVFLLLMYLPWLPMLITQLKYGTQITSIIPEWGRLVNLSFYKALPLTFIKFSLGRITFADKQLYAVIALFVGVVYAFPLVWWFFCAINQGIHGKRFFSRCFIGIRMTRERVNLPILYIVLWLVLPLVISWLTSLWIPNFQPFRLLLILPAFITLVSLSLSFKNTIMIHIIIVFVLGINILSLYGYYTNPYFQREDWRGLVGYADAQRATLLIPSESSNWPVRYYSSGGTSLVYGAAGAEQVRHPPTISGDTVYYLRYLIPVFDPGEKLVSQLETLGYSKIDVISYNQLEVWRFQIRE